MKLLSCYFTSRKPGDDTWPRLARTLERSARLHSPGWEVRIEEHGAKDIAGDRLTSQDMANTQKLRWWAAQVLDAADGDRLLLCDTDVFITGSLDQVWDLPFDVAYTARANHRIPFNAGVVFVRVNDASRWFMGNWAAENERLAGDHQRRRQLRLKYVGINQSALGVVLDEPMSAAVAALPCLEWNCEDSSWDRFNPAVTKIVHVKGELRRDVLAGRASRPALEPLVRLWTEYETLHAEIDAAKDAFLKALKEQSGSKKDLEKEISSTFTASDDMFYVALNRVKDEVTAQPDAPLAGVPYDVIFDEKVTSFLGTRDFKTAIDGFIKKYNELLAASTYFKKGIFNYYNAATIAKQLADNGFFTAKHSLNLNAGQRLEITTQKELEDLITKEKEAISGDKDLKKKFAEIEKLLQKNATVREFQDYLQNHEELLTKLSNLAVFKEDVWKSYIKARFDLYKSLLDKYQAADVRRKEIQQQAASERTQWEEVIDIFKLAQGQRACCQALRRGGACEWISKHTTRSRRRLFSRAAPCVDARGI